MRKPGIALSLKRSSAALPFLNLHLIPTRSFIACAGGMGTLEELCTFINQRTLQKHRKPVALLNTRGFYNPLLQLFAHMIAEGFTAPPIECLIVEDDVTVLLDKVRHCKAVACKTETMKLYPINSSHVQVQTKFHSCCAPAGASSNGVGRVAQRLRRNLFHIHPSL